MPFKTFRDGEVLYAADVNRYWIQQVSVIKPADESLVSTTMQSDDHLVVPLLANTQYWLECLLLYEGGTTGDIKLQWSVPSGAVVEWSHGGLGTSASTSVGNVSRNFSPSPGTVGALGAGTSLVIPIEGRVTTGANAGNLQLQWAQNASDTTPTIVKQNSVLILQRLTF